MVGSLFLGIKKLPPEYQKTVTLPCIYWVGASPSCPVKYIPFDFSPEILYNTLKGTTAHKVG